MHPLYGTLPLGATYVDQGAFELFRPLTGPSSTQKILICIQCRSSALFPLDRDGVSRGWYQTYRGIYSPDGLTRDEPPNPTAATFLGNNNDGDVVERPPLNIIATWQTNQSYWPVVGYTVLSVMHRQTTLNEQRYLQLVQAIKCLLQENGPRNPLGSGNALSATDIENRVVVCFTGGSNGGLQAQLAPLTHPNLVHGGYAVAINPSLQRFYGEHDLGHALSRLSGAGFVGAGITGSDFLHWNQYPWSFGLEMHDLSYLRHFVKGTSYRPACFVVGDEDITSTGTDWASVASGGAWGDHGLITSNSNFGSQTAHRLGWMIANNACHDNQVPVTNAYTNAGNQFEVYDIAHETFADAVTHRAAEIMSPQPIVPIPHTARSSTAQLRGLDDPQEWWLGGRTNEVLPPSSGSVPGILWRDDPFNNVVQGHTAGTHAGQREAMLISDNFLYVGSAEGIVSKFEVDLTTMKKPLVRVARSNRLGHEAFALAAFNNGGVPSLVVGTRRHLYILDRSNLSVQVGPVELPWELAQPHHLKVADVLPPFGEEIVFASLHGGLAFYGTNLAPIHEWPEPGIVDFFVQDGAVTFLSHRGMLASVTFGANNAATLQAASASTIFALPSQGSPVDLERMRVNWTGVGAGLSIAAINLWTGDVDGDAVRGHWLPNLHPQPYLQNVLGGAIDIATCLEGGQSNDATIGDHALVLGRSSKLSLYDQYGQFIASKVLTRTTQGYYPFGTGAHTLAVGELVSGGPSGPYDQEIVVATATGLMWLHVNDLLFPDIDMLPAPAPNGTAIQDGYWMDVERTGGTNTNVQPRTNQTLAAAWAIARKPVGGDSDLHVLDQRGVYWKVKPGGQVALWERDELVLPARGWGYVGAVGTGSGFGPPFPNLQITPFGNVAAVRTRPWIPRNTEDVVYESSPTSSYRPNNWSRRFLFERVFEGFLVHEVGGHVLTLPPPNGGREAWFWSYSVGGSAGGQELGAWGNLVEGLRMDSGGAIDGIWASTGRPQTVMATFPNEIGDKGNYHSLRSFVSFLPIMTQQAIHAVKLTQAPFANQTAVVLGRPGGRVGVLLPGNMRTGDTGPDHGLGSADESVDLGYGASALAVRHVTSPSEQLEIWCGTISHPCKRPAAYTSASGSLLDDEVATGAVHRLTWTPGSGAPVLAQTVTFHPTALNPRGAYGVVGLLLADLFAGGNAELIVATLSGDLYILDPATMTELWRTRLPGAIGCYNSILVDDLDGVNGKELYVAGSWGLWRFVQVDPQP